MARTVLRIYPPIDARFDDVALQQRVLAYLREAHPDYDYEIVMHGKHRDDDCFTMEPYRRWWSGPFVGLADIERFKEIAFDLARQFSPPRPRSIH